MELAPATAPTHVSRPLISDCGAPPKSPSPSYGGMVLGSLISTTGSVVGPVLGSDIIGSQQGYTTMMEAAQAVGILTAGTAPTAGVMDAGGRYFATSLRIGPDGRAYEYNPSEQLVIKYASPNLVAIVEGGTTVLKQPDSSTIHFPVQR